MTAGLDGVLFGVQCGAGVIKIVMAFTRYGRKRFWWHLISGIVILGMGLYLLFWTGHRPGPPASAPARTAEDFRI